MLTADVASYVTTYSTESSVHSMIQSKADSCYSRESQESNKGGMLQKAHNSSNEQNPSFPAGGKFGLIHSGKAFRLRELTSKSSGNPQVPTEIDVMCKNKMVPIR